MEDLDLLVMSTLPKVWRAPTALAIYLHIDDGTAWQQEMCSHIRRLALLLIKMHNLHEQRFGLKELTHGMSIVPRHVPSVARLGRSDDHELTTCARCDRPDTSMFLPHKVLNSAIYCTPHLF